MNMAYGIEKEKLRLTIETGLKLSNIKDPKDYFSGISFGLGVMLGFADKDNLNYETMSVVYKIVMDVLENWENKIS